MFEKLSQPVVTRNGHPPAFINPHDVFIDKINHFPRSASKATRGNQISRPSPVEDRCCRQDDRQACVKLDEKDPGSPDSCEGDCDECEDCFQDHQICDEDQIPCIDECEECEDEHEAACGQHGQVCTEECNDCDFSCFDCIDWNAFEQNRALGLAYSVPLLEGRPPVDLSQDMAMDFDLSTDWQDTPVPPIDISMHHHCSNTPITFPDPVLEAQLCQRPPYFDQSQLDLNQYFGCHPATAHSMDRQQPLPVYDLQQSLSTIPYPTSTIPTSSSSTTSEPPPISCQWLMPCNTQCSATFATILNLKKHLKSHHTLKGIYTCRWSSCTAAFASEAALTGHISKKHLSPSSLTNNVPTTANQPFACTYPQCTKSFSYKQVRDEHIASCHNGNKMYCEVCQQWLNAEGSNFKRHMASHQPKHQHMICKYHHLGCKRRFPRLDNLRRHEASCKFMKKAVAHHHHFHRHVNGEK